jgi:hypothetical protein
MRHGQNQAFTILQVTLGWDGLSDNIALSRAQEENHGA